MKSLLFLALIVPLVSAATHYLQYIYTGATPGIRVPEFTTVGMLTNEQFDYYDSNIRQMIPKTEWIQKVNADDPDYWNRNTQKLHTDQESFKVNVATAMQRFNQTTGVHTVQVMYGCELDDDGTKRGYMQYGYDGEDFLSLDLHTETWTAPVPQAFITKHKWERQLFASQVKNYLENECINWLQKYVRYGRSTLERKVPPEVSLFQKDSSSPVVCHATGFFPKSVLISWQKNGEDMLEDVEIRETLLNQDGTFQKRSLLTVSPEELDKHNYTCVVHHSSLKKGRVLPVDNRIVPSVPSPKVDLYQKDSSSPVVCQATGFFPKSVTISWLKNGQILHEDVELTETTTNQDGTFRKKSLLFVSPEELDKNEYTCVVQHSSLKEDLVLRATQRRVLSGVSGGVSHGGSSGIVTGAALTALFLLSFISAFFM